MTKAGRGVVCSTNLLGELGSAFARLRFKVEVSTGSAGTYKALSWLDPNFALFWQAGKGGLADGGWRQLSQFEVLETQKATAAVTTEKLSGVFGGLTCEAWLNGRIAFVTTEK